MSSFLCLNMEKDAEGSLLSFRNGFINFINAKFNKIEWTTANFNFCFNRVYFTNPGSIFSLVTI